MKELLMIIGVFLVLMAVHSVLKYLDDRDFQRKMEKSENWWS